MMLKGKRAGRNNTSTLADGPNHRHHDDQLIGWTIVCPVKQVDVSEAAVALTAPSYNLNSNGGSVKSDGSDPYQQTAGTWCATSTGEYHCPCSLVVATNDATASKNTLMAETALLAPTNDSTIATASSQKKYPPRGAEHSAYARHKDSALRATTSAKNARPPPYSRRGRSTTPVHQKNMRESSIGAQKCPAPTTTTTATATTNTGSYTGCSSTTSATRSLSTSKSSKHRRRRHRRPTPTSISRDSSFCSSDGMDAKEKCFDVIGIKQEATQEDDRSDMGSRPSRHVILAADTEVEVMTASSPLSPRAVRDRRHEPVCNEPDICYDDEKESKVDYLGFIGPWSLSVQGDPSKRTEYTASCDTLDVTSPADTKQLSHDDAQHHKVDETIDPYECTAVVMVARSSSSSSSQSDFPERPTPLSDSPHTPTRHIFTHTSCSAFAPIDPPGEKLFRAENFALVTKAAAAMCGAATTASASLLFDDPSRCASPGQSRRLLLNPFKTIISLDGMCPSLIPSLDSMGPSLPKLMAPSLTQTVPGFSLVPSRINRHVHRVPNTPDQHDTKCKILPATAEVPIVLGTTVPPTLPRSSILVSGCNSTSFRWSGNGSKLGGSSITSSKSVTFRQPVHAVIPFAVATSAVSFIRDVVFAPGDVVDIVYGAHKNQTGEVVKATSDLVQVRVLLGWTHRLYLSPSMLRQRVTAE